MVFQYQFAGHYASIASYDLLAVAVESAKELGTEVKEGWIRNSCEIRIMFKLKRGCLAKKKSEIAPLMWGKK